RHRERQALGHDRAHLLRGARVGVGFFFDRSQSLYERSQEGNQLLRASGGRMGRKSSLASQIIRQIEDRPGQMLVDQGVEQARKEGLWIVFLGPKQRTQRRGQLRCFARRGGREQFGQERQVVRAACGCQPADQSPGGTRRRL